MNTATGFKVARASAGRVAHWIHAKFLWLLLASYVVAGFFPAWGLAMKQLSFGQLHVFQETVRLSLPMLMLSFLLLNAGLGVDLSTFKSSYVGVGALAAGLIANLAVPVTFILLVTQLMRLWHNPDEVQNILVGLALIASMPIAGSSTAWSQNANGNMALSLGLVLLSTIASPITTPLALHSVGLMTTGDYAEDLHELAAGGSGGFLAVCVVIPSLAGVALRRALGKERVAKAKPNLKLANAVVLLALNYANASVSLPEAVGNPDPDFLAVILTLTVALCAATFSAGWLIARWFQVDLASRTALMFGLGMNNNGTGLVLASMALANHPRVMLPIIFYNLVQHLVAGVVDRCLGKADGVTR
ncbi:MAG TPA: bile acid:sodium symporter [Pirellulales bacterium]